jgi:DNA invertase Pin-like site-specific DNA recombinase
MNVRVVAVDQNIDFNGSMGRFLCTLFLALAEWERATIVERVRAGMSAAKAKGRVMGRPTNTERHARIRELFNKGISAKDIAGMMNVKKAAIYASLKRTRTSEPV